MTVSLVRQAGEISFHLVDDRFVQDLHQLNLDPIKFKLMDPTEGMGWSREEVDGVEKQYKTFLLLIHTYPGLSIVPATAIDEFWHKHVLDTQLYAVHCELLYGKFIHHFPYFGLRGEQDRLNLEAAFATTMKLYEHHGQDLYGTADWQKIFALCGSGCGGSLCDVQTCDSSACGDDKIIAVSDTDSSPCDASTCDPTTCVVTSIQQDERVTLKSHIAQLLSVRPILT